jgi:hypothetical protein
MKQFRTPIPVFSPRHTDNARLLRWRLLELDRPRRTVRRGDQPIQLTLKEYALLELLMMRSPGTLGSWNPLSPGAFGCGCFTPDVAAGNPVIGSGGARAIQFGLKLLF